MQVAAVEVPELHKITPNTDYASLPSWLSCKQLALYLGVTTWFVYENVKRGEIPHRRVGPKLILIPKEYLHANRAKAQVVP